jgi:predicted HTH domain antitoxin
MKALERRGLRISLPDRRIRPYAFKDEDLDSLIKQLPVGGGSLKPRITLR